MDFSGLFKRKTPEPFSEAVIKKDFDRFCSISGVEFEPALRDQAVQDIFAEGAEEYPDNRRRLKRVIHNIVSGKA